MQNRKLILTFLCSLFLATSASAKNTTPNDDISYSSIKSDIAYSLGALRELNTNPGSLPERQHYLNTLDVVVSDFNRISASAMSQHSKHKLDRLALAFMGNINPQNKLGIDDSGHLGGNVFTDINNNKISHDRVTAHHYNKSAEDISVSIINLAQLYDTDYMLVFDTATHYILSRQQDHVVVSTGVITALPLDIEVDGMKIQIRSGDIVAKDRFTISPLANAASSIQLAISDPRLLALGWPVNVESNSYNGNIQVTSIYDTQNDTFSIPLELSPSLSIEFISATRYVLVNSKTKAVIEGPLDYSNTAGANVFPTPAGYNPGYNVSLTGAMMPGDAFQISYNLNGSGDNRNGYVLGYLYLANILPLI